MRILVSCANGSGTSLMMMRSAKKVTKELGVPTTEIRHCAISEGKSSASQYDIVSIPVNLLQMSQQAEKHGVIAIGIKNVMSAKEVQGKYMTSEYYQKSE